MKKLDFAIPFTGFSYLGFLSCFAAVHTYLSGQRGQTDYECKKETEEKCDGCGNCRKSIGGIQEDWYFLFETLSGVSSYQDTFDHTKPCPEQDAQTIDFCMKLAGYDYERVTDGLPEALAASIDAGFPVIAFMKSGENGPNRVLIGYDNDQIIMAEPVGTQDPPPNPPAYDQIEAMLVIRKKIEPQVTLADGLRNIEHRMQANLDEGIWDDAADRFCYWRDNLSELPFEELKARFERVKQLAWNFDNCHNFAETFRHRVWEPMEDQRLDKCCKAIDRAYDDSHTRHWQLIAICDCRDWSQRRYNELEWGMCEHVRTALAQIKKNDEDVLAAVRERLDILQ